MGNMNSVMNRSKHEAHHTSTRPLMGVISLHDTCFRCHFTRIQKQKQRGIQKLKNNVGRIIKRRGYSINYENKRVSMFIDRKN